jgi:hypothetical protein
LKTLPFGYNYFIKKIMLEGFISFVFVWLVFGGYFGANIGYFSLMQGKGRKNSP